MHGYALGQKIGEGRQADVYRARGRSVGDVAVKVYKGFNAANFDILRRIKEFSHPNILSPVDVFVEKGKIVEVTKFKALPLLATAMKREYEVDDARKVVTQLASALDHFHSAGLVYGDVHPGNAFADSNWNATLFDFGSVKEPFYMKEGFGKSPIQFDLARIPPEEVVGNCWVDQRRDVFRLGLLYEDLASNLDLPQEDRQVIAKAMGPVDQRFRNMDEMVALRI